eukprot:m.1659151 g.1659151  ORF g.1659151 m.1659151 type:complete len:50 (-) comp118205_c0_seq1:59-208(-)
MTREFLQYAPAHVLVMKGSCHIYEEYYDDLRTNILHAAAIETYLERLVL